MKGSRARAAGNLTNEARAGWCARRAAPLKPRAMEEKEKREELQLKEERRIARELKAQAEKSALKAASVRLENL